MMPAVTAGINTFLYESPDESITRISLSLVSRPTVIRVPTREAKGADMAITPGREKSTNSATWPKGTCLVRISRAMRSS